MRKKLFFFLLFIISFVPYLFAFDHQHALWDQITRQHIKTLSNGHSKMVDYMAIKNEQHVLDKYLSEISSVNRVDFDKWSKDEQLAFLINAYNAFTIKLILTEYPELESIKDLSEFFTSPWKRKLFKLFGEKVHLDKIEHKLIREKGVYDEPYIHFSLVCAAWSCPPLRNEAYVSKKLKTQLEDNLIHFLSDKLRNNYDPKTKKLYVSEIFDWYAVDFESGYRSFYQLKDFFAHWAHLLTDNPTEQKRIQSRNIDIEFLDYNWRLNDSNRFKN